MLQYNGGAGKADGDRILESCSRVCGWMDGWMDGWTDGWF
jgi:hypothetical protein